MMEMAEKYYDRHSLRVNNAIEKAKSILCDFNERQKSAEIEFPENDGNGKTYVIKKGWMEAQEHCFRLQDFYCHMDTSEQDRRRILEVLLGKAGEGIIVKPSITFDFGKNIFMEKDSFLNVNVTILDWAPVYIGEATKIGSDSKLYTVKHSICPKQRKKFILSTNPLVIGKNVWVGGNCTIFGGITIGDNSIVGTGAVITKDVPKNVIVVGNNKILRKLTSEEIMADFITENLNVSEN